MKVKLRDGGLTWREIDGNTVLLDLHSSRYFRSNRTGTFLLRALVAERQRDELIAGLAERYALDESAAAQDVDAFVSFLDERGLLAAEGGHPAS